MSQAERIKQMHQYLEGLYQLQLDSTLAQLLSGPKYQDVKRLGRYEHKVFSQSGEDGILAEIFRRIGTTGKVFAECAPGDGRENNTVYWLTRGWTGLWIEGNRRHVQAIRERFSRRITEGALRLQHEFVTAENVEGLLDKASLPKSFDLLSIDIDRNDYWVWQGIRECHPRVVVIEYNAIFPPGCDWVVDYAPDATWDETSNCGASLSALERLGTEKGYRLVGCTLAGTNAFFVAADLAGDHFCAPFTAENHYEPPRYYLTARKSGHRRSVS
jgi:hypothetical protein